MPLTDPSQKAQLLMAVIAAGSFRQSSVVAGQKLESCTPHTARMFPGALAHHFPFESDLAGIYAVRVISVGELSTWVLFCTWDNRQEEADWCRQPDLLRCCNCPEN